MAAEAGRRRESPPPVSSPVWLAELVVQWSDGEQPKALGPFLPLCLKRPAEEREDSDVNFND